MNPERQARLVERLGERLAASRAWSAAFLLLVVALVFGQTLAFSFLNWDDNFMVTANDFVRHGFTRQGLAWLPTGIIAYSWHPLTNLSWMLDASLWGRWAGGFHLGNVVYHAAAVLIAWRLLRALGMRPGLALVAAALFAVHPLRAEPVAWITGRKDLMVALFALAAAWAYVGYARQRTWRGYLLVSVLVALAAAAKPLAIVIVPLLVWIDAWVSLTGQPAGRLPDLARQVLRRLPEKLPWALLTALPAAMMWGSHESSGAVLTPFAGSLGDRLAYPLLAVGEYLRLSVWPVGLQYLHPMWTSYSPALAGLAALVLVAVSVGAWRLRHEAPAVLFGWGWFLIALAPGSGIVRIGFHAVAERYAHLPHVGLMLALAAFAGWLLARWRRAAWPPVLAAAAILLAGALAAPYVATWRDSESLYRQAADVDAGHVQARKELAQLAAARGDLAAAQAWLAPLEARALAAPAAEIAYELATFHARFGPPARAEFWFARAVDWSPQVAAVWMARAQYRLGQQRYAEAAEDFAVTLRMRPGFKYAWVGYGYALFYTGRAAEAEAALQKALALDPSYAEPYFHLGVLAEQRQAFDLARRNFQEALRRNPWHAPAQRHLARLGGAAPDAGRSPSAGPPKEHP